MWDYTCTWWNGILSINSINDFTIPAKIAKVPNIMICVPSQNGKTSNLTLAAAYLCGVHEGL